MQSQKVLPCMQQLKAHLAALQDPTHKHLEILVLDLTYINSY